MRVRTVVRRNWHLHRGLAHEPQGKRGRTRAPTTCQLERLGRTRASSGLAHVAQRTLQGRGGPTHTHHVPVKAPGPHEGLVQHLWEVGGRDDDDALALLLKRAGGRACVCVCELVPTCVRGLLCERQSAS